jgi:RNA polymerase sigma factor (sigma-70 family)
LVDNTDATVPVPDIPAAATRDSAIDDQQRGPVVCVPQQCWEDLYKAEMPRLVRYLMKCFGDSGMRDAADAAHNAFVELFTNWDTVRSPRAWLRTVAFRQMLRQNASAEYPLDVLGQEPGTVPASARLELREETRAVLRGLCQLPLAQRQVLALIYDEFSYDEIAQIMGISQAAVRKNAERARRRMRELLGPQIQTGALAAIWDRGSNPPSKPARSRADAGTSARPGYQPSSGPS